MQHLVQLASQGDREAFARLASSNIDRLYAIARRILQDPDRAHDAVQSALLGAWRDLPSLRDTARFEPWLNRLLVRACYDEARRHRAHVANVRMLSAEPSEADKSGWLADRDELEQVFGRLSLEHRAVVVLHFYVGLPLTNVADVLAIPEGTARSRLHYALRQLRSALETERTQVASEGRPA